MTSVRVAAEPAAPLSPHSYSHPRTPFATCEDGHLDESFAHPSKLPLDLHMPLTPPLSDDEHDRQSVLSSEAESSSGSCSPLDDDETRRMSLEHVADRRRDELPAQLTFERKLGETEVSYFLPSRADGVNDM